MKNTLLLEKFKITKYFFNLKKEFTAFFVYLVLALAQNSIVCKLEKHSEDELCNQPFRVAKFFFGPPAHKQQHRDFLVSMKVWPLV